MGCFVANVCFGEEQDSSFLWQESMQRISLKAFQPWPQVVSASQLARPLFVRAVVFIWRTLISTFEPVREKQRLNERDIR